MKIQSTVQSGASKLVAAVVAGIIAPMAAICQTPPPPGGGFNPDQPLNGVPIDTNLTIAFTVVAAGFAFLMYKKVQKRKLLTTNK